MPAGHGLGLGAQTVTPCEDRTKGQSTLSERQPQTHPDECCQRGYQNKNMPRLHPQAFAVVGNRKFQSITGFDGIGAW
jgi:hypothetical protein